MTKVYDRLHNTAKRLIAKYGYSQVLYTQFIAEDGWKGGNEAKEHEVKMIVLPSPKYSRESFRIQNEKDLPDTNYIAYIADIDFIPTINDKFTFLDREFTIVSVVRINPNAQKEILFKLEVK